MAAAEGSGRWGRPCERDRISKGLPEVKWQNFAGYCIFQTRVSITITMDTKPGALDLKYF